MVWRGDMEAQMRRAYERWLARELGRLLKRLIRGLAARWTEWSGRSLH